MLACVCADADTRLRLLRAIVGALAAQCIDLLIDPQVEEYTEDSRVAHYHAVWCAVLCDCATACFCRAVIEITCARRIHTDQFSSTTTPVWGAALLIAMDITVPCLTLLSVRHTGLLG
jgi:hypothetical protein